MGLLHENEHMNSLLCGQYPETIDPRLPEKITCIPVGGSYYERQQKRARASVRRTGVRQLPAAPGLRDPLLPATWFRPELNS